MKRILIFAACVASMAGLFASVQTIYAVTDSNDVITDDQIATIKSRCSDIQASLNRTHESDKVLRVNKGYLYKGIILDKLMTPLNQRIAANQIDGGKLGKIAADFSKGFQTFDDAYSSYERSLSAAIDTDCTRQPTAFYDKLLLAHDERVVLSKADGNLKSLAADFKAEADELFASLQEKEEAAE